ncbi:MAG TPA: STAS domain-containing protein [Candidatus Eisenbacteria bacterium]|nr:STAS domain-containing protein [Candidatus Eisenbacteria bacterium]
MSHTADFEITEASSGGRATILRVRGRLDGATAPALLERCALIQAQGQNLVLNLSQVSFLGSSGIGAMLVLVEQFQEQAGEVRFAELSATAKSVVALLDLGQYLNIHATEEQAVDALAA